MSFYHCQRCHIQSPVKMPKSYIKWESTDELKKVGWTMRIEGWSQDVLCPGCAKIEGKEK